MADYSLAYIYAIIYDSVNIFFSFQYINQEYWPLVYNLKYIILCKSVTMIPIYAPCFHDLFVHVYQRAATPLIRVAIAPTLYCTPLQNMPMLFYDIQL